MITAETPEELLKHYGCAEPYRLEAVVQEIIAGPDSAKYCYLSAYAQKSMLSEAATAWGQMSFTGGVSLLVKY